jgi:hypothetical protein
LLGDLANLPIQSGYRQRWLLQRQSLENFLKFDSNASSPATIGTIIARKSWQTVLAIAHLPALGSAVSNARISSNCLQQSLLFKVRLEQPEPIQSNFPYRFGQRSQHVHIVAPLLLVTPDFIASDFIHQYELGPVLKEAEQSGVRILWVPVRDSSYKKTPLTNYQAVINPTRPLGLGEKDVPRHDQAGPADAGGQHDRPTTECGGKGYWLPRSSARKSAVKKCRLRGNLDNFGSASVILTRAV